MRFHVRPVVTDTATVLPQSSTRSQQSVVTSLTFSAEVVTLPVATANGDKRMSSALMRLASRKRDDQQAQAVRSRKPSSTNQNGAPAGTPLFLQRRATEELHHAAVPDIVHDALRSAGHPL